MTGDFRQTIAGSPEMNASTISYVQIASTGWLVLNTLTRRLVWASAARLDDILGGIKTNNSTVCGASFEITVLALLHTWATFLRKIVFLHLFIYNDVINCCWPSANIGNHPA